MNMHAASLVVFGAAIALSVVAHVGGFSLLSAQSKLQVAKPKQVKVRIVEVKKEEPKPEPPPPPKPEPPKPKEKPKDKPKPPAATEKPKPATPPQEAPKPVQGLSKDALAKDGKGMAAPIGNTLMAEDTGKRVQEAAPFVGDLSSDATLIPSSINKPEYTPAAIDASFEGLVVVEVFVNEKGDVEEAELKKKVGYGLDQLVIETALKAKFKPRKNKFGKAESGWSQITFNMQLP